MYNNSVHSELFYLVSVELSIITFAQELVARQQLFRKTNFLLTRIIIIIIFIFVMLRTQPSLFHVVVNHIPTRPPGLSFLTVLHQVACGLAFAILPSGVHPSADK